MIAAWKEREFLLTAAGLTNSASKHDRRSRDQISGLTMQENPWKHQGHKVTKMMLVQVMRQ